MTTALPQCQREGGRGQRYRGGGPRFCRLALPRQDSQHTSRQVRVLQPHFVLRTTRGVRAGCHVALGLLRSSPKLKVSRIFYLYRRQRNVAHLRTHPTWTIQLHMGMRCSRFRFDFTVYTRKGAQSKVWVRKKWKIYTQRTKSAILYRK